MNCLEEAALQISGLYHSKFLFSPLRNGRAHIHRKNADRVTSAAFVQQIAGIVKIERRWSFLDSYCREVEEMKKLESCQSPPPFEWVRWPAKQIDLNIL